VTKTPRGVATAIVLTISAAATLLYKYQTDRTAWMRVQEKLLRVQSGLQYETILALRSVLADTDAAVKNFSTDWRIYPPDHDRRVEEAEKAVSYLGLALNWETKNATREDATVDADELQEVGKYADVTTFVPRSCGSGRLVVNSQAVAVAFVTRGMVLIQRAEYPLAPNSPQLPLNGKFGPLDVSKETAQCQEWEADAQKAAAERTRAEQARQKAERERYWAQFRYRVELRVYTTCSFDLYIDGKHTLHQSSDEASVFGATGSVRVENVQCTVRPRDAISVSVNGQQYQPKWQVEWATGKLGYRATIIPMQQ
jgi:hypothetical protein